MTMLSSSSIIILKVLLLLLVPGVSAFLIIDYVPTISSYNILTRQQQHHHCHHHRRHHHRHYLSRQQQQQQQQQDGLFAIVNDSGTENTNNEITSNSISSLKTRTTATTLEIILDRMIQYFESMVDPETNQFFLLSYPQSKSQSQDADCCYAYQHCPLRELGCTWDATTALELQVQQQQLQSTITSTTSTATTQRRRQLLRDAVLQTIKRYGTLFVSADDRTKTMKSTSNNNDNDINNGIALHCDVLKEIPNIAHNGLLLLTLIGSERLLLKDDDDNDDDDLFDSPNIIDGLTRGILFMQRNDGAFRTHFDDDNENDENVLRGIEFFSGEAMTALMEVYSYYSIDMTIIGIDEQTTTTINRILPAMKRALQFYRTYYDEGRRNGNVDVNYTIWQVQAFSRLFFVLQQQQQQQQQQQYYGNDDENNNNNDGITMDDAADYCLDMCNDIIRSPSWKMLSRGKSFYPNLTTIEIACGLDALVQGTRVAVAKIQHNQHDVSSSSVDNNSDDYRLLFMRNIDNAIDFLQWSQDRIPKDSKVGYGGLGYGGFVVMEQRLDVTGHALSAISKLLKSLQEEEEQSTKIYKTLSFL
jgi:hypothetical protein